MFFIFSTPVLIKHLWQLKTIVFLHLCLVFAALLVVSDFRSPRRKKITKQDFLNKHSGMLKPESDPADPLSQLDPLWSLK
jgi:hypothetical protein